MKRLIISTFFLIAVAFFTFASVFAQSCGSADECSKLISEYEQKLSGIREQKNTLASQIEFADTQIYLTTLRIQDTERKIEQTAEEIDNLKGRIVTLNESLDHLSKLLLEKIREGYKRRDIPFFSIFIDTDKASLMLNRLKYAKVAEENDRKLAFQVQQAKLNFEQQQSLREQKQEELGKLSAALEVQKSALDQQKVQKQRLLADTQNDERTYQAILSRLRAEQAAIQGIIAGAGTESKMRDVKKGDTIASVISGSSCNSSGTHLHFIVQEGGTVNNPFNYLKSVDHYNDSGGDPFNPSGSWDWPIPPRIGFHQGYGETWAVKNTYAGNIYRFHNGIDVSGSSNSVTAVSDGELYRGSYAVGCTLSYVKLKHKDSNISTLYLHVYPN